LVVLASILPRIDIDVSGRLTVGELIVGVGTVALAVFALLQIAVERGARKEQERRAQAVRVSAWPHSYWGSTAQTVIVLHNGSDEPVYRAVVSFVFIQGAAPHSGKELIARWDLFGQFVRTFTVIPPGRHYTTVPGGWAGMMRRPGVELAFVDQAGVNWLRTADGELSEIHPEPVDYYGMSRPISWDIPQDTVPERSAQVASGEPAAEPYAAPNSRHAVLTRAGRATRRRAAALLGARRPPGA
jgi:hypothetical protein